MTDATGVPSLPTRIESPRLLLRPLAGTDASAMFDAVESSRSELERWMRWPSRLHALDDVRRLIAEQPAWEARTEFEMGIFPGGDARLLGGIDIRPLDARVPSFAIAYWLRTSEVGNGYAREAVRVLTGVALGRLGARRVVIACEPGNTRSLRVAEACGFTFEGRLRHEAVSPAGEVCDLLVYSLIDTDAVALALRHGAVSMDYPLPE